MARLIEPGVCPHCDANLGGRPGEDVYEIKTSGNPKCGKCLGSLFDEDFATGAMTEWTPERLTQVKGAPAGSRDRILGARR